MKKLSIAIVILAFSFSAMAQDKVAGQGAFGIGFGLNALPFQQNVYLTYYVSDNLEIGGALWLQYTRSRSSTFDTMPVFVVGGGTVQAQEEKRTVTSSTIFGIMPMVRYHFKTKNNLDVYTGGVLPIGVSSSTKTVNSDIFTAANYTNNNTSAQTGPASIIVGGGVSLGCRWFFYQNLAVGAETNLGILATIANGNNTTTGTVTNTGSANPDNNAAGNPAPFVTKSRVKSDTETFSLMRSIGFNVTWYFGGGAAGNTKK